VPRAGRFQEVDLRPVADRRASPPRLDPFGHAVYVFANRQRNRIKILAWEKNGFVLWYKRLEKQRFCWPRQLSAETVTLSAEELNWLLDGFDIWRHPSHQRLHYEPVS
jgi:transposase